MRVQIVGLGVIGTPLMCALALAGHTVQGFDRDTRRLADIRQNCGTWMDQDLQALLRSALLTGRVELSHTCASAQAHVVCVPSPLTETQPPECELGPVLAAAEAISQVINDGDLVILESTVPPGTTRGPFATAVLAGGRVQSGQVLFAHVPERIIPGNTVFELYNNERVVGCDSEELGNRVRELYASFARGDIHLCTTETAEIVKLAENAYRDVNIALANEVALLCELHGVDPWQALALANKHPRVSYLQPGPGVGGHCIPIDPWFLASGRAPEQSVVIRAARARNIGMTTYVADRLLQLVHEAGVRSVVLLGRAYKRNVADCRESPTDAVQNILLQAGVEVRICDPVVDGTGTYPLDLYEWAHNEQVFCLMVDHDLFKLLEPTRLGPGAGSTMLDMRNCIDRVRWTNAGWRVTGFSH